MRKIFKTIIVTAMALMMFAVPTFAEVTNATVCKVDGVTDSGNYPLQWYSNTMTNVPLVGTTAYIRVRSNGYGSPNVYMLSSNASCTELSNTRDFTFGQEIGWVTIYKITNLPAGITGIKFWKMSGTNTISDTVYLKMLQ
ncbi:hypothetical protein [Clostridium cellulovorans]|uniref:Uncharacterized protein n=1 Tax=Clostridium cellulovorans (strain ATCC 35296 / DSM 3052 / OCM 3 / 743B) TaxID=573061 RepID=D9SP88_CLOC7|nr:hypothetical protein [Clostridium cellulovorans]ADL52053.1 hypothetical protein Clocel_2334 [Clostridium cellulovorans 743B]